MPNYGVKHLNCVGGSCDKKWDGSGKNDEKVENVKKSIGTIASTAPWRSAVPEHLIDFIHRKRKRLLTDLTDFITSWTELRGYLPPRWRLYRSICVFLRIMGWDHFKVGFFFYEFFRNGQRLSRVPGGETSLYWVGVFFFAGELQCERSNKPPVPAE